MKFNPMFNYTMLPYAIIIAINVIIFLLPQFVNFGGYNSSQTFLTFGWKENYSILQNGEWYRLLTSMFLHGGFLHLAFNMYSLWDLGGLTNQIARVQEKNAPFVFLAIYFFAGICGGLASMYFNPGTPSVGASGAIFGLIGAIVAFALYNNQTALLQSLVNVIILNLIIGFSPGSNIDNSGHIGGLVGGALIGFFLLAI
jgi:rhomboid protease GluP